MKKKTKSIIVNSSLVIFLMLFFWVLSTIIVFQAPPQYEDRCNKKQFDIEMPENPMMSPGDTSVLPLKHITFCFGIKGYLWCTSAFFLIFLAIRNLFKLIFRRNINLWELDALLALSIISVNIVLLSQTLMHASYKQYEAINGAYLLAVNSSLTSMIVISSFFSCIALCIYFIGKQQKDFNKELSANSDSAAEKSE